MLFLKKVTTAKKHKKVDIPTKPDWYNGDIPENQKVTVAWHPSRGSVSWNEICASVLEVFGLPGDRFYYKPYMDFMVFTFKSKKDADLCKILLSENM